MSVPGNVILEDALTSGQLREVTAAYDRQTDPLRRQHCGLFMWQHGTAAYPAATREPVVTR